MSHYENVYLFDLLYIKLLERIGCEGQKMHELLRIFAHLSSEMYVTTLSYEGFYFVMVLYQLKTLDAKFGT